MNNNSEEPIITIPDNPIEKKEPEKEASEITQKQQKNEELREKPLYTYVIHFEWFKKQGWKNLSLMHISEPTRPY